MIKKLMMLCVAAMAAMGAWAATETVNGITWTYTVSDGEAILSGVSSSISGDVIIPSRLGGCPLVEIDEEVFLDCKDITSVVIGEGVRFLDKAVFENCEKLQSVSIPSTLNSIEYAVWGGCRALQTILLPNGSPYFVVDGGVLYNKDKTVLYRAPVGMKQIIIPITVKEIAYCAFEWSNLREIDIPDSVRVIGRHAFGYCKNLERVKLPQGIMYDSGVEGNIFDSCDKLTEVEIMGGNLIWRDRALYAKVGGDLVLVSLPNVKGCFKVADDVTVIGREAIQHLEELTAIVFSKSVRQIGEELGYDCGMLEAIIFQRDFVVDDDDEDLFGSDFSKSIVPVDMKSRMEKLLKVNGLQRTKVLTWSTEEELSKYMSEFVVVTVSAVVADGCEAMGKVTGGKTVKAGTKVTLKATANKGYVFMGWYEDEACTKLCSAPGVDYTKVSVKHTVVDYDQTLYAKFKSDEPEGGDGVEVLSSYGPFTPGVEVALNLGLIGYTAKKLPSGLKLDKKTGIVKGKAKKPGEYQATFTKKGSATLTAKFIVGPMPTITITMEGDTEKCKVKGASKPGKGYLVGKKVSLSAKGPKGTAFTGWFKDGEPWPNETEYLESKLKYVMTEENLSLVARFEKEKMSVACDGLSTLTVGEEVSIPIAIETQSGVKSVKGSKLPSGLKVKKDKATGEWFVTGKPKKVGAWNSVIKVTAKSGAVEQLPVTVTVEDKGEVVLPSANHYFREPLKNGKGEKYVVSVGISNVEEFLPNLELTKGTLNVSGLPEGLKYDAKKGKINGIATKPGAYTVTLTVTDGKAKYVSTITIEVEPLPDWVVGTFEGWNFDDEWDGRTLTVTISNQGKMSTKQLASDGNRIGTYNEIFQLSRFEHDAFVMEYKGRELDEEDDWVDKVIYLRISRSEENGVEYGVLDGWHTGDDRWDAWEGEVFGVQNIWSKDTERDFLPEIYNGAEKEIDLSDFHEKTFDRTNWGDPVDGCSLRLKFGKNGAVTAAFYEPGASKATGTVSATLMPYNRDGDTVEALSTITIAPKGRHSITLVLYLKIDTSRGMVYGDDIEVVDYLMEAE